MQAIRGFFGRFCNLHIDANSLSQSREFVRRITSFQGPSDSNLNSIQIFNFGIKDIIQRLVRHNTKDRHSALLYQASNTQRAHLTMLIVDLSLRKNGGSEHE